MVVSYMRSPYYTWGGSDMLMTIMKTRLRSEAATLPNSQHTDVMNAECVLFSSRYCCCCCYGNCNMGGE